MDEFLNYAARVTIILLGIIGACFCLVSAGATLWELYNNGMSFSCNVRTGIAGIILGIGFFVVPFLLRKLLVQQESKATINPLQRLVPLFFLLFYVYALMTSGKMICEQTDKAPDQAMSDHAKPLAYFFERIESKVDLRIGE